VAPLFLPKTGLLLRGIRFLMHIENPMTKVSETVPTMKKEHGFNMFSVAITVFLMLSFVGAIMYVLISSL